jgi:sensor histidine kinase YesM
MTNSNKVENDVEDSYTPVTLSLILTLLFSIIISINLFIFPIIPYIGSYIVNDFSHSTISYSYMIFIAIASMVMLSGVLPEMYNDIKGLLDK